MYILLYLHRCNFFVWWSCLLLKYREKIVSTLSQSSPYDSTSGSLLSTDSWYGVDYEHRVELPWGKSLFVFTQVLLTNLQHSVKRITVYCRFLQNKWKISLETSLILMPKQWPSTVSCKSASYPEKRNKWMSTIFTRLLATLDCRPSFNVSRTKWC